MLQITRLTCSGATTGGYCFGSGTALSLSRRPLLRVAEPNRSAAKQQNKFQMDTVNSQQNSKDIELDFTPDNPNFTRARDDETLYWSSTYRELSHPDLFTRAAKTRVRLIPDLKKTLIKLSTAKRRRIFNGGRLFYDLEPPERRYELRLTGRPCAGAANRILMTGYVWVQCSDAYSMRKIKKRLAELTWLESTVWAPVHVYLEPIIAAHSDSGSEDDLYDDRTGIKLGGGFQLHVDIARAAGESDSFCGRPCRSRITLESKVVHESFCRVGGVLRINDSVDAMITTAHGIMNYFLVLLENNQVDASDESSDDDSDESSMEEFLSQALQGGIDPDSSHADKLGYMDVSRLQQWEPLEPFDTITYIAKAEETDTESTWNLDVRNFDADYALFRQLERPSSSGLLPNNIYTISPKRSNDDTSRSTSTENHDVASPVASETSYILLGAQGTIPVQLLPGEVEISLCGVKFMTLKLQAPGILG
ncbi:hypothetical protein F5B18DRAFT_228464 [Nemania serpens]|nr:hypothetical protein F5B18DRAFT_228464 [Nemania serpens]